MYIYNFHSNPEELNHYGEIINDAGIAYEIAETNNQRDSTLERIIMTEPYTAYEYAVNILKRRWPEAEEVIKTDAKAAFLYAKRFRPNSRKGWPEAEEVIMTGDPKDVYTYAQTFKPNGWPEAEPYIAKNAESAFWYAAVFKRGRWPEAEEILKTDAHFAYLYAKEIIEGRWHEAEEVIMADETYGPRYKEFINRLK